MAKHGLAVAFHMLVESDAGLSLGKDSWPALPCGPQEDHAVQPATRPAPSASAAVGLLVFRRRGGVVGKP
jgi:hypothetical protein